MKRGQNVGAPTFLWFFLPHKMAKNVLKKCELIRGGCGGDFAGGPLKIQNAGNELAERPAQMAQHPLLQRTVILRAAKQIAHQLAKYRVTLQELHHARGYRAAQKRAAIETPH